MPKQVVLLFCLALLISGCHSFQPDTRPETTLPESPSPALLKGDSGEANLSEPSTSVPPAAAKSSYTGEAIIIYNVKEDLLQKPLTDIPYYRNGEIVFLEDHAFAQHAEGHQPWLANGLDVVMAATSNLTGEDNPFLDKKVDYSQQSKRTTASGIVVSALNNEHIELYVPAIGRYDIKLRYPEGTSVLFVTNITLYPSW